MKSYSSHLKTALIWASALCLATSLLAAESDKGTGARAKKGKNKVAPAAASAEGEEGQSQASGRVQPIHIARPGELKEPSLSGTYRFYLGSLHSHSGYSGDHAKVMATKFNQGVANYDLHKPAEIFARAKTNFYDFYFVTDHSSPEQNEFYRNAFTDEHWAATKQQAEAATTPAFAALRGYEFSRNNDPDKGGLGHMNVLNSAGWNSAYAAGHTFQWLYNWMGAQTNSVVVAQFDHPQMPGKGKNFKNYEGRTKARNEVVRLAEIWNSGENMHYLPVVQKIWSLGWKVAPTAGTDVHGLSGVEKNRLRTGVLAESLTPEGIMAGLKARRVYATLEPTLHFEFTLNGAEMGSELERRPEGDLKVKLLANDLGGSALSRVEVYGGKYEPNGGGFEKLVSLPLKGNKIAEGTVPNGYDFYYAALFKEGVESARAFSSPIWMDQR